MTNLLVVRGLDDRMRELSGEQERQQQLNVRMDQGDHEAGAVMREVVQGAVTIVDFREAMWAALATSTMRIFKRALCGWLHGKFGRGLSKAQVRRVFREVWGDRCLMVGRCLEDVAGRFMEVMSSLRRMGFVDR